MVADKPTFDEASLQRALGAVSRDGLIPIITSMAVVYGLLAVGIALHYPLHDAAPVAGMFAVCALGALVTVLRLRSNPPPLHQINPILTALFALVLLNGAVAQIKLAPSTRGSLPLLIAAAGFLLLDWRWLLVVVLAAVATWFVSLQFVAEDPPVFDVITEWFAAAVVAFTIHYVHVRTLKRFERLRQLDVHHQHALTLAVERAEQSEDRFRTFSRATFEGIAIHDQGVILDANQVLLNMLGYSLDEIAQRSSYELFVPEARELVRDKVMRQDETPYEVECIRRDGTIFPAEICGRPIEYQGRTLRVAAVRDITQRKRSEVVLHASENRYRQMFEGNLAVKLLIDPETGRIIDANTSAARFYGYERETLLKMHIFDINALPPDEVRAAMRRVARTEQVRFQFRHRLASGAIRDVEVFSSPLDVGDKELLYSIITDITERKQIEAEREQLIAELDSFGHTVAHDLKNPLSIVMAYARLLEEDYDILIPEQRGRYLREISNGGNKMMSIIDELLLLAQMRQSEVVVEPLDMLIVVADVCTHMEPMLTEYEAELLIGDNWPPAMGYAPWVEEVWVNYMSNALKYGGSPPRVELGAMRLESGCVRFWVRDNGAGLSPEKQAQLFKPFNRLERLNTTGYGLGLSIAQRIVEKLGGEVGVESMPGEGCRFYFDLPVALPDNSHPAAAAPMASGE